MRLLRTAVKRHVIVDFCITWRFGMFCSLASVKIVFGFEVFCLLSCIFHPIREMFDGIFPFFSSRTLAQISILIHRLPMAA